MQHEHKGSLGRFDQALPRAAEVRRGGRNEIPRDVAAAELLVDFRLVETLKALFQFVLGSNKVGAVVAEISRWSAAAIFEAAKAGKKRVCVE